MSERLHTILASGINDLNIPISDAIQTQLIAYVELMAKWNKAYNLTAVRDPAHMVERHILDSLSILPYVSGDRIADVGTGAGLPGIVLALVRSKSHYVLIDSNGKKTRFLSEVKRQLGLKNVEVIQTRVEKLKTEPFDMITSRAFADAKLIVEQCHHVLAVDGKLLMMKGEYNPQEYENLPQGFQQHAAYPLKIPTALDSNSASGVGQVTHNSPSAGKPQRHCVIVSCSANLASTSDSP